MVGIAPPTAEISCSFEAWGRAGKRSNRYNFGSMTASDSAFDYSGEFSGSTSTLPVLWIHCRGRNCSTWATVKLGIGYILVDSIVAATYPLIVLSLRRRWNYWKLNYLSELN